MLNLDLTHHVGRDHLEQDWQFPLIRDCAASRALCVGTQAALPLGVGEAIGYWGAAKWEGNDPLNLTAYPDSNGIRVASNVTGTIYVAYKKAWSDTYGNGESGTLATVPTEWAEFMAYDAARSYRASQGSESGFNPIALRDVNNALERALMKPSKEGAIAALTNQLKTQYSTDNSI